MKTIKDKGVKHQFIVRFAVVSGVVYSTPTRVLSRFEEAVLKIMCKPFSPLDMRVMVMETKDIKKMIRALRGLLLRRASDIFDFPDKLSLLDDVAGLAKALKFWRVVMASNKGLESVAIMRGDVEPTHMDYTMVNRETKARKNENWGMETTILTDKVDETT